jgi:hypothetical protein
VPEGNSVQSIASRSSASSTTDARKTLPASVREFRSRRAALTYAEAVAGRSAHVVQYARTACHRYRSSTVELSRSFSRRPAVARTRSPGLRVGAGDAQGQGIGVYVLPPGAYFRHPV